MNPAARFLFGNLIVMLALLTRPLAAQDAVIATLEEDLVTRAARRQGPPPPASRPPARSDTPFAIGTIAFRPQLSWRYLYAEGLAARDGRRVNSMLSSFAPGLIVELGDRWSFAYTPTWMSYTARAMDDTLDHSLRLRGEVQFEDWLVEFTEAYRDSAPTLLETARQTQQRTWHTNVAVSRTFGSDWSIQTIAGLNERYAEESPDTRDWSSANWVRWQPTKGLSLGLGITVGYQDIVAEPDATYESYLAQVNWRPNDRWSLSLEAGQQDRSSRSARIPDQSVPVYNASVRYQPFSTTTLSVAGARTVSTSYFGTAVTESSNWSASLEQRLLGHFFMRAAYSWGESDYTAEPGSIVVGRVDERRGLDLRLSTLVLRRASLALVYNDSRNRSNFDLFDFDTTQYGVEIGWRY